MPPRDPKGRFGPYRDEPMTRWSWAALIVIAAELAILAYYTGLIRPLG